MASAPIIAQIAGLRQHRHARKRSNLHELAEGEAQLPDLVRQSPVAMRYLRLLGPLAWDRFPERDLTLGWPVAPVPYAALAAAYLIKLDGARLRCQMDRGGERYKQVHRQRTATERTLAPALQGQVSTARRLSWAHLHLHCVPAHVQVSNGPSCAPGQRSPNRTR
jgi:hypothetical protein